MMPPSDAVRAALRREALCAAAVRALTGDAALHYRGGRLCRRMRPLPFYAPHLHGNAYEDDFPSLRGAADAAAMRLAHSDASLHRLLSPEHRHERLLFELFEQIRCEALAMSAMRGMRGLADNLRHRFESWSHAYCRSGLTEGELGILIYTVVQIVWSRVTAWPVLAETENLIEATRAGIVPRIGAHLAGLRRHRSDQRAYGAIARELARCVASMIDHARTAFAGDAADEVRESDDPLTSFSLWVDFEESDDALDAAGTTVGGARTAAEATRLYRAYTTQFDRECRAGALVRPALLREYRERLDERIAASGLNLAKIARMLQAALAVPRRDGWSFGEEDGRIDGRRLAQIVSSPAERRVFARERLQPHGDCVVGFLIDCSASMKAHVDSVAMLVDTLVRASEQAGLATEVLGFTTGAWNGGRAHSEWLARGRPAHPGRLNELRHLVFKRAGDSWRRARTDIAALFKADLFREGVDGEAVQWACTRLSSHASTRRILVVISDGSPMDSATAQANGARYLDAHLNDVLERRTRLGDVEVIGLGAGCDLSAVYRHCMAFDPASPLDMASLTGVAQWIGAHRTG